MSPDVQRLFLRWGYFTAQELKTIKRMLREGPASSDVSGTRWDLYEELDEWEKSLASEVALENQ